MRAIWSFWTLPHRLRRGWHWGSEKHFLLSWVLSFETARRHYPDTALYTDEEGARLLVDGLELPFCEVSTALNDLNGGDPDWWMLGKLRAYREQSMPFVHIDYDVYLWKALPLRVITAPLFAQNVENAGANPTWYATDFCEKVIRNHGDGVLPPEWIWYRTSGLPQEAACCGIMGANDAGFVRSYASSMLDLLSSPGNRVAFGTLESKMTHNPLFEQFYLCACAAYYGVRIEYLLDPPHTLMMPETTSQAGYTHLISSAKSDRSVMARLEGRVARDYPERYKRCLQLLHDAQSDVKHTPTVRLGFHL